MNDRDDLTAYLATLAALVVVFLASLAAAAWGSMSSLEALGVGTVTGGLIGVLNKPAPRNVTVDNSRDNPVPSEDV